MMIFIKFVLGAAAILGFIFSAYMGLFMGTMATDAPDTPHSVGIAVGLAVFAVCVFITCGIPIWIIGKL
ncbi:MAG: hypothetical protein HC887_08590 [Desulfobacteraceae bacterium]|nr:hypothetical protein [Desulfobacteraceae bacterium]